MVTTAVSQPTATFDGKVALQIHTNLVPAQRNSVNRPAGTIEHQPYSLTAAAFRECQTDAETGILDTIMDIKDPNSQQTIVLDNAPPHKGGGNQEYLNEYCLDNGYPVDYEFQSPYSPDINANDLSINMCLQKRSRNIRKLGPQSMDGLVDAVEQVWNEFNQETLANAFGLLYAVYN